MQNAQFELNAGTASDAANAPASPVREPLFLPFQPRADQAALVSLPDAQPELQESPCSFLIPKDFRSPEIKLNNSPVSPTWATSGLCQPD